MHTLIDSIVRIIIEAACTAAATAGAALALQAVKAVHIKLTEAQEAQLRAVIRQAAQYAEEAIEAQVKQGQGTITFVDKGQAKMRAAVAYLNIKAPQLTPGEAETRLKTELSQAGVGVTAEKRGTIVTAIALPSPTKLGAD